MSTMPMAEIIKAYNAPFLTERGFTFEYFHEKGGDSSCVYICRFRRGKDYFDFRETSGRYELNLMIYGGGQYAFPDLTKLYKKQYKVFKRKHFFSKATINEVRPSIILAKASCIFISVLVSMELVASSRMSIGGRVSIILEMQRSCRCP